MSGYLLVRSGGRRFGLPVEGVLEIVTLAAPRPAPAARPAMRGLVPVRERLVPLVHLAAVLDDVAPPEALGDAAVLVRGAGQQLAVEVDDTDDFVPHAPDATPTAWNLPWVAGVARQAGDVIPVVDLDVLVERARA